MQASIVIASVLKPVNDTRMFEKMAVTLSGVSKYKIFIIGYKSKNIPEISNIVFLPLYSFTRLSIKRLFAPWEFLLKLIKIKPKLVIVNTYELLGAAIFYKLISSCNVIYDVRENHFLNVLHGKSLPWLLRGIVAYWVRSNEAIASLLVNHFILAEKSYANELPFIGGRFSILENRVSGKAIEKTMVTRIPDGKRFLICGTLSEEYGIFEGIDFYKRIGEENTDAQLEIVGYCANKNAWKKIEEATKDNHQIKITGGQNQVNHEEILNAIGRSNYLLMPYQNLPQIISCFPTKLFEAVALECPVLISSYGIWRDYIVNHHMGLLIDFKNSKASSVLNQLQKQTFYPNPVSESVYWESSEEVFCKLIVQFI